MLAAESGDSLVRGVEREIPRSHTTSYDADGGGEGEGREGKSKQEGGGWKWGLLVEFSFPSRPLVESGSDKRDGREAHASTCQPLIYEL